MGVAGVLPEERGQPVVGLIEEMDREHFAAHREGEGVIEPGNAHQKSWRVDTALGVKTDQATGAVLAESGGHDQHRVVELADQLTEHGRVQRLSHAGAPRGEVVWCRAFSAAALARRMAFPEFLVLATRAIWPTNPRARTGFRGGRAGNQLL